MTFRCSASASACNRWRPRSEQRSCARRFNAGVVSDARIRIYHRTAVRQQVITPKVFLNTLLHEWVHHFDFAGLRLPRSPHTAGFYARLRACS